MKYEKGVPQGDCLTHLNKCLVWNTCVETLYHTTKIETTSYVDGKLWHQQKAHEPDGFSKIK